MVEMTELVGPPPMWVWMVHRNNTGGERSHNGNEQQRFFEMLHKIFGVFKA